MSENERPDRRLIERGIASRRIAGDRVEQVLEALPDLAENAGRPSPEDLEKLGADLSTEQELRAERIERALARAAEPPPAPAPGPVEPFEESEL